MRESQYAQTLQTPANVYEHPCSPLTKILSSGTFYHATYPHWDLSTRLSERLKRENIVGDDLGAFDDRFVWNEYIVRSLLDFRDRLDPQERQDLDRCQFIVCVGLYAELTSITKVVQSDTSNSGLCRGIHCATSCSSSSRLPNYWDFSNDI
jgi:SacI homology domain